MNAETRITDIEQLIKIFFKAKYVSRILKFLKVLEKEKALKTEEWKINSKKVGISLTQYYGVIKLLKQKKMVYIKHGEIRLSKQFANMLDECADFWRSYIKNIWRDKNENI